MFILGFLALSAVIITHLIGSSHAYSCAEQGNCCTPGVNCPPCLAPVATKQRVRKDLKSLTRDQFKKISRAIWRLKNRKRGKTYDYFVAKHTATQFDTRANQAHAGSHFIGYHAMLLLEFENEILKFDPSIEALPYWDFSTLSQDNVKPMQVFLRFFGSAPGSGDNYQVVDGYFSKFPVAKVDTQLWESFDTFRRSVGSRNVTTLGPYTASGYLRDPQNENTNPYVTRYPPWIFDPVNGTCVIYDPDPYIVPWEGVHPFCSRAGAGGTLISWNFCVEAGGNFMPPHVRMTPDSPGIYICDAENPATCLLPSMHGTPHLFIGSEKPCDPRFLTGITDGDFKALSSVNDPIFWFHHNNLERSKIGWMENNADTADVYYGFPLYGDYITPMGFVTFPNGTQLGLGLNEVMSSSWGFTDADVGIIAHPNNPDQLWTHADVVCWLQPNTAPYTYDVIRQDTDEYAKVAESLVKRGQQDSMKMAESMEQRMFQAALAKSKVEGLTADGASVKEMKE